MPNSVFLDDPTRPLLERVFADLTVVLKWIKSEDPPTDGTAKGDANTALRRAMTDLELILGPEEEDEDEFETIRSRRAARRKRR